jgi:hypothetical protein
VPAEVQLDVEDPFEHPKALLGQRLHDRAAQ